MQFDYDKVKNLVQINEIQMYASIQNFGSFALKLTCSNYLLYDPACETVERKAVNYVSLIKIVFNIKHRHRFVKKWVYRAIIIVIWLTIVREVAQIPTTSRNRVTYFSYVTRGVVILSNDVRIESL